MNKQQILDYISKGRLDKAFKALKVKNSLTLQMLRSQYESLMQDSRRGLISYQTQRDQQNRITMSLINAVQEMTFETPLQTTSPYKLSYKSVANKLMQIKKKVRFGFDVTLKNEVNSLLNQVLDYIDQRNRDELFDPSKAEWEMLAERYKTLIEKYERTLVTKGRVMVVEIKRLLRQLEEDFNKDNALRVTRALVAHDKKYNELHESLEIIETEGELTSFAMQLAETVDQL